MQQTCVHVASVPVIHMSSSRVHLENLVFLVSSITCDFYTLASSCSPRRALIETSNRADFPKVPHCQHNDTESFSELITLARLKDQEAQILSLSTLH